MADELKKEDSSPPMIDTLEGVKAITPEKVSEIVVTTEEIKSSPRTVADTLMTLDEIRAIPLEHYPIIVYCDGGSPFGWLIRTIDKAAASHLQILYGPDQIASQWFWYKVFPVEHLRNYNAKLIWNPEWTSAQRAIMIAGIKERLALGKWATRYDTWGVIGEAIGAEWMQRKAIDFCSEAVVRIIRKADPTLEPFLLKRPSPTPREYNIYTKSHNPPYQVYGRHMVDDEADVPPEIQYSAKRSREP